MGRKLRKVPKDWVHPRDKDGDPQPVFDERYDEVVAIYKNNCTLWNKGEHPDQLDPSNQPDVSACKTYAD